MLNCIKNAYLQMEKEGLTPLDFSFPAFSITTNQYKNIGMTLLEDKIKIRVDSGDYGIDFGFDNIEKMNKRIQDGLATDNEVAFFKKVENKILKKIEADPGISKIEMSHAITNKVCGDSMSVMLASLSYYQGFKEPQVLSERQANKISSNDHLTAMSTMGSLEENQFVASLIMLKAQLPKAYKVAAQAVKTFADRATNVEQLHGFDLNDSQDLKLANKIVAENQLIKNMVYRIQSNEKAPSVEIVKEIAKIDTKFAQEHFPLQMQKVTQVKMERKNTYNF